MGLKYVLRHFIGLIRIIVDLMKYGLKTDVFFDQEQR